MQRYGHEGYPVVDNNHVIGLVTRRAVDRAISHKLNLTARKIMESGEITISPDDSLEQLQLMSDKIRWGKSQ